MCGCCCGFIVCGSFNRPHNRENTKDSYYTRSSVRTTAQALTLSTHARTHSQANANFEFTANPHPHESSHLCVCERRKKKQQLQWHSWPHHQHCVVYYVRMDLFENDTLVIHTHIVGFYLCTKIFRFNCSLSVWTIWLLFFFFKLILNCFYLFLKFFFGPDFYELITKTTQFYRFQMSSSWATAKK